MSKAKTKTASPGVDLLRLIANNEGHGLSRSWDRTNHARVEAMNLAVRYALRFDVDDGKEVNSICSYLDNWEGWYSIACGSERGHENMSAAQMIEKHLVRKPFLVREDPKLATPSRVYVGFQFKWYGELVTVTSFNDAKQSFTACTYKLREQEPKCEACGHGGWVNGECKIERRFTITHDDIREYHAALKANDEMNAELRELPTEKQSSVVEFAKAKFGKLKPYALTVKQIELVRKEIQKHKATTA